MFLSRVDILLKGAPVIDWNSSRPVIINNSFFIHSGVTPSTTERKFFFNHLKGNETEEIMRLVIIIIGNY